MGYIFECKLNELTEELKKWQVERQMHIEELAYIEKQMQAIYIKREELKREHAFDDL